MSEPFLAEIKMVAFNFAPKGWALCDGQLLPINQNQALFSLLGTTYGGDGRINFALPNLQGRTPIHIGNGIALGQLDGETSHTLTSLEMPAHTHQANADGAAATSSDPTGHVWAALPSGGYSTAASGAMLPGAIASAGGNQPHDNMQPYLVVNIIIALQGIFPSQN